ncbi:hypothetical protein PHMEG_00027163 [Phytophthora megakarya]|uniref:WWE domain-containing protein n=1 Tax=Phytophthora megakarya TaxID=4795 RepID=A0A225V7U6_9STRA|nr:hypothetical protein PHMEG_00027163 [Phytophthora megakarya]
MLELTYISVMQEIEAVIAAGDRSDDDDWYEHIPNEMELADYAHELDFLPDLTEPSSTVLDYTGPNVMNKSLSEDEQRKLVEVLKHREGIMIASGNTLPPPAYGVVCDIDVQGQAIGIGYCNSAEEERGDIRLCIDYKRVNAVTTIMKYAMLLVDDLLIDMEAYLWFYSLDAASGFWAVMMTGSARKRMMDNALWGFVQPKGDWKEYSERMRLAEKDVERT